MKHQFEEKPLLKEYIANTMMGIEFLWGGKVQLETYELTPAKKPLHQNQGYMFGPPLPAPTKTEEVKPENKWRKILYTMEKKRLSRGLL